MQRSHADGCAGARPVCFIGKGHSSDAQAETVTVINGHSCQPLPLEMNAPHSIDRERKGREIRQAGACLAQEQEASLGGASAVGREQNSQPLMVIMVDALLWRK
jgi:hypothetical protein